MSGPRLLLGAVLLLLVVGGALFWFLSDDPGGGEPIVVPGSAAPATDRRAAVELDAAAPEAGDDSIAREVSAAEAEAREGPPASYLESLGGIIGRVVEPDGTPVPGMAVELFAASLEGVLPPLETWFGDAPPEFDARLQGTVTDDEGRFRFDGMHVRAFHVLGVDLGGARAKAQFVDHAPNSGELVDLGDVVLDPYAVFFGRVVDERKQPVPGARVRATNLPSLIFSFGAHLVGKGSAVAFQEPPEEHWRVFLFPPSLTRLIDRFPVPETRTDADGKFRLEGVPLGLATVVIEEFDPVPLVPLVHGPVPTGDGGGERDLGTLRLEDGETFTGIVLDEHDEPVAGAEIYAGPQIEMFPAGVLRLLGVTDDEGRFSVPGFTDDEHIVAARERPGANWVVQSGLVPGYDEAELRLVQGTSVKILVQNELGETLSEPALVIQPIDNLPLHPYLVPPVPLAERMRHNEDGTTSVSGLDKREYSILAKTDGYAVGRGKVDLKEGPGEITLVLVKELAAVVTVVAAGSKAPVEWSVVGAHDVNEENELLRSLPIVTRRTDETGRAELVGLKPGRYRLLANHPAYAIGSVEVDVPGEAQVIELRQGGDLRGRVHSGGRALDEPRFIGVGARGDDNFPRFTVTDENGEFSITHLEPGGYSVVIMRRFATRPLGDFVGGGGFESMMPERNLDAEIEEGKVTQLDIDMLLDPEGGPTAQLRGRVLLNGAPREGLSVSARPEGQWRGRRGTVTDALGYYDLGQVRTGKVTVSVLHPGGGSSMFERNVLAARTLDLAEGASIEANFEIRTGGLRGKVVAADSGAPLLAANVRMTLRSEPGESGKEPDRGSHNMVTDKDGAFSAELLAAGTYDVAVHRDGFATSTLKDVRIPYNSFGAPLTVRMVHGVELSGTVQLPTGMQPGEWMYLEFRDGDDRRVAGGRVDTETMEYSVDGLLPGRYTVQVYSPDVPFEEASVEVPTGGAANQVIHVVMQSVEEQKVSEDDEGRR